MRVTHKCLSVFVCRECVGGALKNREDFLSHMQGHISHVLSVSEMMIKSSPVPLPIHPSLCMLTVTSHSTLPAQGDARTHTHTHRIAHMHAHTQA